MTKTARSYPLLVILALLALPLILTLAQSRGAHSQAQTIPTPVITRIVTATRSATPTPLSVSTLFVDADATGNDNGTSWEDAFTTLQPALDAAVPGDAIWVAAGTYTPTHEFSPGDPRSATFQLKNGMALYGGSTRRWATSSGRTATG